MAYATYDEYTARGGRLDPGTFARCAAYASQRLDYFTRHRLRDPAAVPGLADCCCEMVDIVYRALYQNGGNGEKKSESTDGYSVTYITQDGADRHAALSRRLYQVARVYLAGTGLLYGGAGVRC